MVTNFSSDEKMDFLTKLIKPQDEEEKPKDVLFDASAFKANKNQRLPLEARRILTILPQYRLESEVHYVSDSRNKLFVYVCDNREVNRLV